ncbi:YncE family protein [Hydrotalea sp.]|uniref:YncE family protein n=1 Tax=Hydrotalea sp. TaxID=2881279 RepID=UPI002608A33F|nr:YncE family protein [Hydrotalea sp.]
MKSITFSFCILLVSMMITDACIAQSGYHLIGHFPIASSGWWDYITVDAASNKLYVSHGTQVNILDKNTGDSLGIIPNTKGVHGIVLVHALGKGYTSNGGSNNVTVFRLSNNAVIEQIATGENPDAIMYDGYSKKIITCNGRSKDLSVIDPVTDKVVGTIAVGGKPETAVSDDKGKIFVNIEDKSEIAVIDIKKMSVIAHWPIAPGESPTGLAIDIHTNRLFAGCEKRLMVVDANNGKIVADLPIGEGCDGLVFDPALHYICTSNGSGTMTVIKELSKDKYEVVENVLTMRGARTSCVDEGTHTIYMPTANFEPIQPGEKGRPKMIAGSFQVIKIVHK